MEYDVIILAAGKGERTGLGYNKMLYQIDTKRLYEYACEVFLNDPDCQQVILVSNDIQQEQFPHYKVLVVEGGETRQESAYKGLQYALSPYVLIHDGARANLSKRLLQHIKLNLQDGDDCVVPYLEVTTDDGSYVVDGKSRQTPQGFRLLTLLQAQEHARLDVQRPTFRDDASLVTYYLGTKPTYVLGEKQNFKITTKADLAAFIQLKSNTHS